MPFGIRAGLRRLLAMPRRSRAAIRADMDEELRFFLESRIEQLVARGVPRTVAETEAVRRLGASLDQARHRLHDSAHRRERQMRFREWLDTVAHDLRFAVRGLAGSRGFAAGVILTLGLGIGANAAMFGVVDRLLFRPPAFLADPAHVHRVYLRRTFDGTDRTTANMQYRRYLDLQQSTTSFDQTAAFFYNEGIVGERQEARRARVAGVSASFFPFFDAPPALGRYFTAAEDATPRGASVTVLGHGFWQSRFGGSADVLGQQLRIDGGSYEIIGVAPPGFTGADIVPAAAFIPITAMGAEFGGQSPTMYFDSYNMSWMEMLVHRRPDVTVAAAAADLTVAFQRSYAAQREMNPRIAPAETARPRALVASILPDRGPNQRSASKVATWVIGVTAIVLLVACANVANLLLARAFGRRREVAIRLALGVSRGRLVAQLLTENLLLAAFGGALGLAIAQWGGALLRSLFLPATDWGVMATDARTVAFTTVVTVAAGLLAGLVPALHAGRLDLTESLKAGVREGTFHRSRTRSILMVAQAALSVILLVGAGLFVRSLLNVQGVRLGFDPERITHISFDMRSVDLPRAQLAALKRQALERARQLPGVEYATRGVSVPFWQSIDLSIYVDGIDSTTRIGFFQLQAASPDYFRTMGTRLTRGRGIESTDVAGSPLVMVVSEGMANGLWPGQDPIGKCVRINADTMPCHTVVGVAENIVRESLRDDPGLQYYLSSEQWNPHQGGLFVRTRGDASRQAESVRRELQRLMPGDAFVQARPMTEILHPVVQSWRLGATLFVAFGGLALVLASIGLYSVIAYHVAQRMHELGVRVALGAQARDVRRLVLGQGVRLAIAGVAIGAAVALWAGRFIEPLLFGASPRDPVVFTLVAAVLLGTALAASLLPARRATRADPLMALRNE
jgi:predicted permease